jgi:hypothetical protein
MAEQLLSPRSRLNLTLIIFLRAPGLKGIRLQMWEGTIGTLAAFDVASDPALGISGVLDSIDKSQQNMCRANGV